jgi:hypothetical protein
VVIDDMILLDAKPSEQGGSTTSATTLDTMDPESLAEEIPF